MIGEEDPRALFQAATDALTRWLEGHRAAAAPGRGAASPDGARDPAAPADVLRALAEGLADGTVRTDHPRYFGLPHASPSLVAVLASTIAAAHNPQLATTRHAPFAAAVERRLVAAFAEIFGLGSNAGGVITGGGAEANLTALVAALARRFPAWQEEGVRALPPLRVYASSEAHPTVSRAVRVVGLGTSALRVVPTDGLHRLKLDVLRSWLEEDEAQGRKVLAIVGTAGTTSAGAIDPLPELATLAERAGAWFHVDAAWGGLLGLVPEERGALVGIERADSVTFDPHKSLAVPLGTGMLLTRHPEALVTAFRDRAGYMPREASQDFYARSLPWSRRFAGAPLHAVLATLGFAGIAAELRRSLALAGRLEAGLRAQGFAVLRPSALPVVCFHDPARPDGRSGGFLQGLAGSVIADGAGWLSVTRSANGQRALRAAVPNHRTSEADVERLLRSLERARARLAQGA